ncbi:MAG: hypothetical protein PHW34_07180 [Hespellia sp.]|nr:hypothetical protein [Hespellia sp.]
MVLSYNECVKKYSSNYKLKKALDGGELYKLAPGIYSEKKNVLDTAIIKKKYPNSVFTLNSAFYYQGLTDTIPSLYYLATDKDATKIRDKNIKQIFDNNHSMDLGVEIINYNEDDIRVFSKERLLIELVRNKNKLPFDYYKEIIGNYRRLIYELDFQLVEEYAEQLPKTKLVMDTIQMEVF